MTTTAGNTATANGHSKSLTCEPPLLPRHDDAPALTMQQIAEVCKTLPHAPIMPMVAIPILLIGAGGITREGHLPAYAQCGWKVIGITDLNRQTAEETANMFGIPTIYDTAADLIKAHAGESVVFDIATPASAILGILEQLPDAAFVLMQKPMGEDLNQARAICDLCTKKNITAAVNHQLRTAPYVIQMKELIKRGVIGEITSIDFRTNVFQPWDKWKFLEKTQGRMELIYHSVHYVDLMRDLYGDPHGVHCATYKHIDYPRLSAVSSNILFFYSPTVQTVIHSNHQHRWGLQHACCDLKIEGTKGCVIVRMGMHVQYPRRDLDFLRVATDATNGEWYEVPIEGSWMPEAFKGPMANLMRKAEGSLNEIPTRVQDVLKTMTVIAAAHHSAENPTPVNYHT